jgi:SAM-dependent methyltransferase
MKWLLSLLFLISTIHAAERIYPISHFLDGRISQSNPRYKTFHRAMQLARERNLTTLIETGTARFGKQGFEGDGGSTIIFAHFATMYYKTFYSVDTNQQSLDVAYKASIPFQKSVHFVCEDSVSFLTNFPDPIDFLYLDSFDYIYENPIPSQLHHLAEIKAAFPKLTPNGLILIDDCNLPGGGKGKIVIEFLTARGWKVILSDYQVLLSR